MSVNAIGPAPLPEKSEPVALTLGPYIAPSTDAATAAKTPVTAFDKADGPSFSDLIDLINPLQHIPLINIAYRQITGDTQGAIPEVIGGAIYGGFIGLGAAVAGLMVQEASGQSVGDHIMAMFRDDSSSTAMAQAKTKTPAVTVAAAATAANPAKPVNAAAAAEPPPVTAAPRDPVLAAELSTPAAIAAGATTSAAGPIRAGDYMIFGSGGSVPVTVPTASSNRPTALTPANAAANTASKASGPSRSGDFLVFGSVGAPVPTTLPTTGAGLATGEKVDDQAAAPPLQQAAATTDQPRMRPVPAATGRSSPLAVLPMPTTGPGAVPGGHSQALRANGMGASASPLNASPVNATTAENDQPNQWFNGAFSQAMDKYQRASRLSGDNMPPVPSANADSTPATLN